MARIVECETLQFRLFKRRHDAVSLGNYGTSLKRRLICLRKLRDEMIPPKSSWALWTMDIVDLMDTVDMDQSLA